jgi:hypothetical protein
MSRDHHPLLRDITVAITIYLMKLRLNFISLRKEMVLVMKYIKRIFSVVCIQPLQAEAAYLQLRIVG